MVLVVSVSICMDGGAFYGGTVMLLAVSEELSSHHRSPQEQSRCLSFAVTKPPEPSGRVPCWLGLYRSQALPRWCK